MAFCTEAQVRNSNKDLIDTTEVPPATIEDRISEAEKTVIIDLSTFMTEDEINATGASSNVINHLTLYKAVENTLVTYHGANRQIDEVTDIQYFQKLYKDLLKKVLDGVVKIIDGAIVFGISSIPVKTSSSYNKKFYNRKGVEGFIPDGGDDDVKDDRFKK